MISAVSAEFVEKQLVEIRNRMNLICAKCTVALLCRTHDGLLSMANPRTSYPGQWWTEEQLLVVRMLWFMTKSASRLEAAALRRERSKMARLEAKYWELVEHLAELGVDAEELHRRKRE